MHIKKCVARKTAMNSKLSEPTFQMSISDVDMQPPPGPCGRTCWHAHHAIEPHQSGNDAKLANQIAEEIVGSCLNYNIWLIDSIIRKMLDLNLLPQEMLIKHSLADTEQMKATATVSVYGYDFTLASAWYIGNGCKNAR